MKVTFYLFLISSLVWIGIACQPKYSELSPNTGSNTNPDWTTESHSGDAPPSYSVAFSQTDVKTMEITMTADQWKSIQTDMAAKSWGTFGIGSSGGGMPGGNPGGGSVGADPAYIALPVYINGKLWTNVGFRLKGNSSLASAWRAGIYKLPSVLKWTSLKTHIQTLKISVTTDLRN